jgi:hypothetical protein
MTSTNVAILTTVTPEECGGLQNSTIKNSSGVFSVTHYTRKDVGRGRNQTVLDSISEIIHTDSSIQYLLLLDHDDRLVNYELQLQALKASTPSILYADCIEHGEYDSCRLLSRYEPSWDNLLTCNVIFHPAHYSLALIKQRWTTALALADGLPYCIDYALSLVCMCGAEDVVSFLPIPGYIYNKKNPHSISNSQGILQQQCFREISRRARQLLP